MDVELLARCHLGQPTHIQGIGLVPLFLSGVPSSCGEVGHPLRVEERHHSTVETLSVTSPPKSPVLVAAGTMLRGGLQDRVTTRPTWIQAGQTAAVPVHCVEQSRWAPKGGTGFTVERVRPGFLHRRLRGESSQDRTWRIVAEERRRRGLADPGGSVHELREGLGVDALASRLVLPWAACGVVAYWQHPGAASWPLVEWFASAVAFRDSWPGLRRALAAEHLERLQRRGVRPAAAPGVSIRLSHTAHQLKKAAQVHPCWHTPIGPKATGVVVKRESSTGRTIRGWASFRGGSLRHLSLVHS